MTPGVHFDSCQIRDNTVIEHQESMVKVLNFQVSVNEMHQASEANIHFNMQNATSAFDVSIAMHVIYPESYSTVIKSVLIRTRCCAIKCFSRCILNKVTYQYTNIPVINPSQDVSCPRGKKTGKKREITKTYKQRFPFDLTIYRLCKQSS